MTINQRLGINMKANEINYTCCTMLNEYKPDNLENLMIMNCSQLFCRLPELCG